MFKETVRIPQCFPLSNVNTDMRFLLQKIVLIETILLYKFLGVFIPIILKHIPLAIAKSITIDIIVKIIHVYLMKNTVPRVHVNEYFSNPNICYW